MAEKPNNILVMQSGGSTAVLNRSLAAVARAASERDGFGEIYGAVRGIEGLVSGRLVELGGMSGSQWGRIALTPGAALGSTRHRAGPDEMETALKHFDANDIGYCFIIGGNDSAETGHTLHVEAQRAGLPLSVVHVPKTIDNDLPVTDHSPGYGSAARFVALAAMGIGRDVEAMGRSAPVAVLEVMGRDAGWLAAAPVLGKREGRDAPHVVVIPETPVVEERFLGLMDDACAKYGAAVAVVAENARGERGPLGGGEPWYVDDFGHEYYEGAGRYLAELAGRRLGVRVRYEKPGSIQRSLAATVSRTDAMEAEMVGRAAVIYAQEGAADVMVTLERQPSEGYVCYTGAAPLDRVAGKVKAMPPGLYDSDAYMPTPDFVRYAEPLIGGPLPRFERLDTAGAMGEAASKAVH